MATVNPLVPPPPGGWAETFPRIDRQDPDPVLTLVTPETQMMDTLMRVMIEAMNRQQETITPQQETVGENSRNGSGVVEAVGVTEETRLTGIYEKRRVSGCSYKSFMSCKPPEFAWTAEPVKCIHWLKGMEAVLEACECDDDQQVKFASRLLKGDALAYIQ